MNPRSETRLPKPRFRTARYNSLFVVVLFSALLSGGGVPSLWADSLDLGDESILVQWIRTESFESADWVDRWFVESQGPEAFSREGALKVRPVEGERSEAGTTVWMRKPLPRDVVISVKASTEKQQRITPVI